MLSTPALLRSSVLALAWAAGFGLAVPFAAVHAAEPPAAAESGASGSIRPALSKPPQFFQRKEATKPVTKDPMVPPVEVLRFTNNRREDIVAILNSTTRDTTQRLHAPLVIVLPAFGKRKESTSGLALTLVEYNRRLNPVSQSIRERFGEMNAGLAEAIAGIEVVKSNVQEKFEWLKFTGSARAVPSTSSACIRVRAWIMQYNR